ncbi:ABC-type spermidine/putrescine transport system ATPase component [Prochlorococcus sp. MIT 0601]|nr:ABC-type spermidine/putrescine transport system ATPase component [Prochlorococcus sp. MIT 0601]
MRGELLGLLGPSGCGKTTLLRIIAGFERPLEGSVTLNNSIISSSTYVLPPEQRDIGMVFQDYALFPHLNVWKNVCFGLKHRKDTPRASWLLELVGLEHLRNKFPHQLSGGQRQRLALARALAPGTSLLVLDEPFCSLDVEVRHTLRNVLSNVLKSCSATAILVTHDPQEALGICDRVAVMKDGTLHQCSSPSEMLSKPATPFIGKFVFQNNIIPIDFVNSSISTPYGTVIVKPHLLVDTPRFLMFDEMSLEIVPNNTGLGLVESKEFRGSYWIARVKVNNEILRVWLSLDTDIKIGEHCDINFVSGKYSFLYPGCISCILKSNA